MKKISVVGFGKIGQAITAHILNHNVDVSAVDINPDLINAFELGHFQTTEPGVKQILQEKFYSKRLTVSLDVSTIVNSQALIVCLPLGIDDMKRVVKPPFLNGIKQIAPYLNEKVLLVIETSVPIGFSRNYVLKSLEDCGKTHGKDFLLIHSPERIKSGTMLKQLLTTPKVIGGIDDEAADMGMAIYGHFFESDRLHKVKSIEAAEMIKLAGMAYRDITIGLSNLLARFSQKVGIDFLEVLDVTNTDGETHMLEPGIGVGGHCTPVYPYFLIKNLEDQNMMFDLANNAREINDTMANYAIELVEKRVNNKRALILGLSFRPNIKEDTCSTSYLLKKALVTKGYDVSLYDNLFSESELKIKGFVPINNLYQSNAEVVFLITLHDDYKDIHWTKMYDKGCRFVVDGRNGLDQKQIEDAGITYIGIGKQ